jgi:hypothetical protein
MDEERKEHALECEKLQKSYQKLVKKTVEQK